MTVLFDAIPAIRNLTTQQQEVFRSISSAWVEQGIAFGISGGLTKGQGDAFSDLDFFFSAESGTCLEEAVALACEAAPVLFKYYSNHMFMKNSAIIYFDLGSTVVKVDISAIFADDSLPEKSQICYDPAGIFGNETDEETLDHAELAKKFAGWMWIIHGRIERGELLSAVRCIDFCRELVVLPIMLDSLGLPQSGHRRLEQLLPARWLDRVYGSVPRGVEKAELARAADTLLRLFLDLAAELDGTIPAAAMQPVLRTSDIIGTNGGFASGADADLRLSA